MVRVLRLFVFVIAALSVLTVAVPTRAQSVEECQTTDAIAELRTATAAATFTGKNPEKDLTGLLAKLEAADTELQQGKIEDAVQKLTDFRDKVASLQAQVKIDPNQGQSLFDQAEAAITCLEPLAV
jgi:hypothetical protein